MAKMCYPNFIDPENLASKVASGMILYKISIALRFIRISPPKVCCFQGEK